MSYDQLTQQVASLATWAGQTHTQVQNLAQGLGVVSQGLQDLERRLPYGASAGGNPSFGSATTSPWTTNPPFANAGWPTKPVWRY